MPPDQIGPVVAALSDEFGAARAGTPWRWVRQPSGSGYGLAGGTFRLTTVPGDLLEATAPALLEAAPAGNYAVGTKLRFPLPGGTTPVIHGDDHNFLRLTVGALGAVRHSMRRSVRTSSAVSARAISRRRTQRGCMASTQQLSRVSSTALGLKHADRSFVWEQQ